MNICNKLKRLGFRKISVHKPARQISEKGMIWTMIPDSYESVQQKVNDKLIWKNIPKSHPKSNSSWKYCISDSVTIWILVENFLVKKVWIQDDSLSENLRLIWGKSLIDKIMNREENPILSESDLLNLFPKAIKRHFIIKKIT